MSTQITAYPTNKYHIGLSNNTAEPYNKNGNTKLGGYTNRESYCWEALVQAQSSLPSNITVIAATCDVNITSYFSGNIEVPLDIRLQDGGSWTDDGSSSPSRGDPIFFNTHDEWTTTFSSVMVPVNFVGILTIPSTPALVDWIQQVADGMSNDGLMITYYPDYYGYWIESDSIEFTVEYEQAGRRRIMIIS